MTPGPGMQRTILPKGFFASGVNCGVRRYRPDIGLIYSETDAVGVAVYTQNELKAAPILYCQELLPSNKIRALVTNSGQANAATGPEGVITNKQMAEGVAAALNVSANQVLTASTGVIGQQLAIDKILPSLPELVTRATNVAENFALAILTTDLVPKSITTVVELSTGPVRITGISKGSGMIHPNMATMLGYLLTDAEIPADIAQTLLTETNDKSFNMISVDGDSSTNDCVFFLANGASKVSLKNDEDYAKFKHSLLNVSQFLAQAIAADGEGATKLIEVELSGSPSLELARKAARSITISPLIKTAIHGEDPNWGRIVARLGAEKVPKACLDKMVLKLQGHTIYENGKPAAFNPSDVKNSMKEPKVQIFIDLNSGAETAIAWGCDLSKKYVEINTEYS